VKKCQTYCQTAKPKFPLPNDAQKCQFLSYFELFQNTGWQHRRERAASVRCRVAIVISADADCYTSSQAPGDGRRLLSALCVAAAADNDEQTTMTYIDGKHRVSAAISVE